MFFLDCGNGGLRNGKNKCKDYLGKEVFIEIDRPLGSRHPKHGFITC